MAMVSSEVATGRSMNGVERLIGLPQVEPASVLVSPASILLAVRPQYRFFTVAGRGLSGVSFHNPEFGGPLRNTPSPGTRAYNQRDTLARELLQLLHRNRRALPARPRHRPVPDVAARLGAGGGVEERRRAA